MNKKIVKANINILPMREKDKAKIFSFLFFLTSGLGGKMSSKKRRAVGECSSLQKTWFFTQFSIPL